MQVVYKMDITELTPAFIRSVKKRFKHAKIVVSVIPQDETEYLLSSEANREALLESIRQMKEGRVVNYKVQEFFETMQKQIGNA